MSNDLLLQGRSSDIRAYWSNWAIMEEKIWQKLIAKSILPLLIWQNRAAAAVEETQCCSTIESAVKSLFCPIRSRIRKIKDGHFIIVDDCCTWQVSLYCLD